METREMNGQRMSATLRKRPTNENPNPRRPQAESKDRSTNKFESPNPKQIQKLKIQS
jgi:hypothetical protein